VRKYLYLIMALTVILCASSAKPDNSEALKPGIAFTYANDKMTDGAGAQLQRVYGIYALSRFFHVPYIHTRLMRIDYQGLTALEKNASDPRMQDKWNQVFTIPSDIALPPNAVPLYVNAPTAEDIEQLKSQAVKDNKFYLARILIPFKITDANPELYRCVKQVSPFHPPPSNVFRIAIHVRRGEELVVESQRMLPNSYYIAATMRIVEALKRLNIPFVCDLYTEVASRPLLVTGQSYGMNGRLKHPAVIDPRMNRLGDFDVIPHLQEHINGDPIEALKGMATADALIISRSSFSYFAALFNPGIVIYYPFWHHPLSDWLISDMNGKVSSEQLMARLKAWKRRHASVPIAATSH
jgi:hypothetical protein